MGDWIRIHLSEGNSLIVGDLILAISFSLVPGLSIPLLAMQIIEYTCDFLNYSKNSFSKFWNKELTREKK